MAELNGVHDKLEDIPEEYQSLYTEKNGKWELTGIKGVKTQADFDRLDVGNRKERDAHKATKLKLAAWNELDPEETLKTLERVPELELAAKGKLDDAKIEEIVAQRLERTIKSRTAPIERENKTLKDQLKLVTDEAGALKGEKKVRTVQDHVGKALDAAKALPGAREDAFLWAERHFEITDDGKVVTKDQVGVTPGIDAKTWVEEMKEKKPHWWPASVGGGARGSGPGGGFGGGPNPFSGEGWNLTEQGKVLREHGPEKAGRLASAAGTTVGGPRPLAKK